MSPQATSQIKYLHMKTLELHYITTYTANVNQYIVQNTLFKSMLHLGIEHFNLVNMALKLNQVVPIFEKLFIPVKCLSILTDLVRKYYLKRKKLHPGDL